jgi:hypothetical protein
MINEESKKEVKRYLEKEFEILKTVGQGSFGIVRQVRERA